MLPVAMMARKTGQMCVNQRVAVWAIQGGLLFFLILVYRNSHLTLSLDPPTSLQTEILLYRTPYVNDGRGCLDKLVDWMTLHNPWLLLPLELQSCFPGYASP